MKKLITIISLFLLLITSSAFGYDYWNDVADETNYLFGAIPANQDSYAPPANTFTIISNKWITFEYNDGNRNTLFDNMEETDFFSDEWLNLNNDNPKLVGFGWSKYIVITSEEGGRGDDFSSNAVPIPGAVWLLGSCLLGLIGVHKRNKN